MKADARPDGSAACADLTVDRKQIRTFVDAIFQHAGKEGYVARRAFYDNGGNELFGSRDGVRLGGGLKPVVDAAVAAATKAAQHATPVVFCWPLAVFRDSKFATEADVTKGLVLSVDCDKHPTDGCRKLETILGTATAIVASGGDWDDTTTGEIEPKVHLHWRLNGPAATKEARDKLKRARQLATELVGGDHSNDPLCHPIRWPGSWHPKAEPRLCRLTYVNHDIEIDLDAALAKLEAAVGDIYDEVRKTSSKQQVDENRVAVALAVLPNEGGYEERADWVRIGMAVAGATGCSEYGGKVFDAWSQKWSGYNAKETERVWRSFCKSPPTEIGAGTIF